MTPESRTAIFTALDSYAIGKVFNPSLLVPGTRNNFFNCVADIKSRILPIVEVTLEIHA